MTKYCATNNTYQYSLNINFNKLQLQRLVFCRVLSVSQHNCFIQFSLQQVDFCLKIRHMRCFAAHLFSSFWAQKV